MQEESNPSHNLMPWPYEFKTPPLLLLFCHLGKTIAAATMFKGVFAKWLRLHVQWRIFWKSRVCALVWMLRGAWIYAGMSVLLNFSLVRTKCIFVLMIVIWLFYIQLLIFVFWHFFWLMFWLLSNFPHYFFSFFLQACSIHFGLPKSEECPKGFQRFRNFASPEESFILKRITLLYCLFYICTLLKSCERKAVLKTISTSPASWR